MINIKSYLFFLFCFLGLTKFTCQAPYFQQEVNYVMEVALNDKAHTLSGFQKIQYINNATVSLEYIYFHLWPNAYKNNKTALAKQLLKQGKTDLYFAKKEELGFIDSLDFKINGEKIRWEYDNAHQDICKLLLNKSLGPGDTIQINTSFFVKIPDAKFSRLGHVEESYFITQWYPKPAVFDNKGWHPMPYLDMGEFYSEFGSFDVSITLPENYVLAATGDRINATAEELWLNNKSIETITRLREEDYRKKDMRFPPSSERLKTIRFVQRNVHDFAWFADKRYNVLHDQITLSGSNKPVDTWVFFTNKNFEKWKHAIIYLDDALMFYSHFVGDYPYNHATAVDGTIMAGGGMEYPNITVIGDVGNSFQLDQVIAHEVGHNWFYGILANNERKNPFLDEGINSFYDMRYIRAKYPELKLTAYIDRDSTFKLFRVNKTALWREKELLYFITMKSRRDQPVNLASEQYTEFNYGSVIYSKTPMLLDYMMEYIGQSAFDRAMNVYFEKYKFKHVEPDDLFNTLVSANGNDFSDLRKFLFETAKPIDFKLKKVRRNDQGNYLVTIKNKTQAPLPVNVYGFKNNKPVGLVWLTGIEKQRTVEFPGKDVDYFKIDGNDRMPDINRSNNIIRTGSCLKGIKPLQLNLITALEQPGKTQINYLPILGSNYYNGFMAGLSLHNYGIYRRRFEFHASPLYGFRSKTLTGFAEAGAYLYPNQLFQHIYFGAKAKSFAYDEVSLQNLNPTLGTDFKNFYLNFYKITPHIEFELKKKDLTSPVQQKLILTSNLLFVDSADYAPLSAGVISTATKYNTFSNVNQISYELINKRTIDPFSLLINLQEASGVSKVTAAFNYQLILSKKHDVRVRFFAGSFLSGSTSTKSYYAFRASGYTGSQDYTFDGNFAARNETRGFGFSQFLERDGALKIWTPLGYSTTWMTALNIKSPALFRLPIRLFADVLTCDSKFLLKDKVLWDAGFNLSLWKDIIEIYAPIAYNKDIRETLKLNNINPFNRIRFTFNIHKLVPRNLIQNTLF